MNLPEHYLLNNLHIFRSAITLNTEEKIHNFKIVCPTEVWKPIGSVIVSYIIILHVETSFELQKNISFNNLFLEVAHCWIQQNINTLKILPVYSVKQDISAATIKVCSQKLIKINLLKWIKRLLVTKLVDKFFVLDSENANLKLSGAPEVCPTSSQKQKVNCLKIQPISAYYNKKAISFRPTNFSI